MRSAWLAIVAAPFVLLAAACASGHAKPTATPSANAGASTAATSASPTHVPSAAPDSSGYPATWRTGVSAVDLVLNAFFSGNPDQLAAQLQYRSLGCVTARATMPSPPICAAGQPAGTVVDSFPVTHIEAAYLSKDDAQALCAQLIAGDWRLYAVYGQQPFAGDAANFPRGSYAVILNSPANNNGLQLQVENGYILAVEFSAGPTAQMLANVPPAALLLAPPR
jgi:hypothetical protein